MIEYYIYLQYLQSSGAVSGIRLRQDYSLIKLEHTVQKTLLESILRLNDSTDMSVQAVFSLERSFVYFTGNHPLMF